MVDFAALVTAPLMAIFGDPYAVTFTPRGASTGFTVAGVFDEQGQNVTLSGDAPVTLSEVRLAVQSADFVGYPNEPQIGARVSIGRRDASGAIVSTSAWVVKDVQPDGIGGAKLVLASRAA